MAIATVDPLPKVRRRLIPSILHLVGVRIWIARAIALFMTATALAGVIGGPVSGLLLSLDAQRRANGGGGHVYRELIV